MSAEGHVMSLTDAFSEYFVECSCGWKGSKGRPTRSAAVDDWDKHCGAADYYAMSRAVRIEAISEAMMWAEYWADSGRSDADAALSAAYSAVAANHIALLAIRDAAAVHGSSS